MSKPKVHIWLRDETKPFERRTALTPAHARELLDAGFFVSVESSTARCFPDEEYRAVGVQLEPSGSWVNSPSDCIILGIKELPDNDAPLSHQHICFAHAYKGQRGWERTIRRFKQGGGLLLDLEFLVDDLGRRVAAFGRWAGFAGAALAVDIWAHQQLCGNALFPEVEMVKDEAHLLQGLRRRFLAGMQQSRHFPRVIIIGAGGRCGAGARDLLAKLNFPLTHLALWDMADTAKGGPFSEILEHEILVNCVLVQGEIKPFITNEMLQRPRTLSVISDVSCDPQSPYNPLPVYDQATTFAHPVVRLDHNNLLDLTAIDHLPALLPRESSEDFGAQLLPSVLQLGTNAPVWTRARHLFESFKAKV